MATTRDKYILEIETEQANRGIERTRTGVGGLFASLGRLGPAAGAAAAALGGIAAVSGISNRISEMDELAKRAQAVGAIGSDVDFEGFQVASQILEEMGLSTAEADRAFKNMTTRLQEAADTGKGPAADAFEKIRDAITDANGNLVSTPELFQAVTQALQDGTLSMTDARKVLGDVVGPKILGGFERLAEGGMNAADAFADAAANSNIVDREAAENAEAFGDTMGRLQNVAGRLGTELVTALLPTLNQLAEGALEILPGIIESVKTAFANLEPVFSLIGTVLTELVFPIMAKVAEILGTIASAIAPLVEAALPAFKGAFEFVAEAIQFVVDKIAGFIETLGNIKNAVVNTVDAVKESFSGMTDGITSKARDAYNGVTGWFSDMYDEVVGNSIVPDMASGVLGEFESMATGMVDWIKGSISGVTTAFTNVANTIGSAFEDVTGISLQNVRSQVATIGTEISNRVSSLVSSVSERVSGLWNRVSSTFGNVKSTVGGFFSGINLPDFAGFFANGGFIRPGQFGVVGERGPELVSGPANVTPLGAGGMTSVTYNINAVDASSFRALVAQDPEFIHAVVQQGAKRLPGRR